MSTREYKGHTVPIHEGPMADTRGTGWRESAAKLEALEEERIESPMQTLPNGLTTIDKARATRSKSDEGTATGSGLNQGGDFIETD